MPETPDERIAELELTLTSITDRVAQVFRECFGGGDPPEGMEIKAVIDEFEFKMNRQAVRIAELEAPWLKDEIREAINICLEAPPGRVTSKGRVVKKAEDPPEVAR